MNARIPANVSLEEVMAGMEVVGCSSAGGSSEGRGVRGGGIARRRERDDKSSGGREIEESFSLLEGEEGELGEDDEEDGEEEDEEEGVGGSVGGGASLRMFPGESVEGSWEDASLREDLLMEVEEGQVRDH